MGGRGERGQLPEKQLRERQLPAALLKLQGRFAAWRAQRRAGQRIPEALWGDASTLAEKVGLHRTASVLKLDYYSLKKRLVEKANRSQSQNQASQISQFNGLFADLELLALPCRRRYTIVSA